MRVALRFHLTASVRTLQMLQSAAHVAKVNIRLDDTLLELHVTRLEQIKKLEDGTYSFLTEFHHQIEESTLIKPQVFLKL